MFVLYSLLRYAVMQSVESLRYKPEDRGFDFQWGYYDLDFILSELILRPHYGPGIESVSNRIG
jgi:hypothetical protein